MQLLILAISLTAICASGFEPLESDDIINTVNNAHSTWKAGRNFHQVSENYLKRLLGHRKRVGKSVLPTKTYIEVPGETIPDSFDARDEWPNCKALRGVRDQGDCGSCWAVAGAATLTDRFCIASNGSFNSYLSAEDVLTCCSDCGDGCDGGFNDQAWKYFNEVGIVSGGNYGSKVGCQPYKLKPCEHHTTGTRPQCDAFGDPPTPKCFNKCTNKKYKTPFLSDKYKTSSSYVISSNVKAIQKEILAHGPVEAGFTVYRDFLSYKTDICKSAIHTAQAQKMTPGPVETLLRTKLTEQLKPVHLDVINESHMHNVPKGSERHFKVVVVTDLFNDKSLLQAKTPDQWKKSQDVNKSPGCLGGFGQ